MQVNENFEEEEDDYDYDEPISLGFVQDPSSSYALERQYFPSKAGGAPAWLDPIHIPSNEVCKCSFCGKPLSFLLQIYAPAEEVEDAFHRTLYIFICKNAGCMQKDAENQANNEIPLNRSVQILRCQMARNNDYYNFNPPQRDKIEIPKTKSATLCDWCQTFKAEKKCSKCHLATYCSREHQIMHWRNGHSKNCNSFSEKNKTLFQFKENEPEKEKANIKEDEKNKKMNKNDEVNIEKDEKNKNMSENNELNKKNDEKNSNMDVNDLLNIEKDYFSSLNNERLSAKVLWIEKEIIVEEEEREGEGEGEGEGGEEGGGQGGEKGVSGEEDKKNENKTKQLLNEYLKRIKKEGEYDAEELQGIEEEKSEEKKQWVEFQTVLSKSPSQVIRYGWSNKVKVLWPCVSNQPTSNQIPICKNCGGSRIFEFQILPQLLYFLLQASNSETDTLDFGTLAFYTCENSCHHENEFYVNEFVWIQLMAS